MSDDSTQWNAQCPDCHGTGYEVRWTLYVNEEGRGGEMTTSRRCKGCPDSSPGWIPINGQPASRKSV